MFKEKNIKPMLLAEIPFAFSDKYLYEIKFDGIRALIYVTKDKINIRTRNNIDVTSLFPELAEIKSLVKNDKIIFDGEIVLFANETSSFSALQKRLRLKNTFSIKEAIINNPVVFVAFDIIYQNKSLINKPLVMRKKILDSYDDTDYFIKSKVYDDGENLFKAVKKKNLEGIVAKEKESLYYPNKRSRVWIKLKNVKEEVFLIGGYIKNAMSYSLLLGSIIDSKLYYVGKVKVSNKKEIVSKILKEKKTNNKFVNYMEEGIFIKPKLKIKVKYLEKTPSSMLRHPFL